MTGVEVNAVIDKLADKLAVPAGKLMELLPALGAKTFGTLVMYVVVMAVSIFVVILVLPRTARAWADCDNELYAIGGGVVTILFLLSLVIALVGALDCLPSCILWLYNPQAWALDYILHMIR